MSGEDTKEGEKMAREKRASRFYDSVVRILGEMSGFKAAVGVSSKEVIQKVLQEHGLAEDSLGFSEKRKDNKSIVVLRIEWAFRNQRPKYRKKKAYCQGAGKRGQWALTQEGVGKARELAGLDPEEETPIPENEGGPEEPTQEEEDEDEGEEDEDEEDEG
jgi:hypothetical protein